MNIQEAKEQVRRACIAYLTKDEFGDYIVPSETQRPVFLLGAPGVGKTAIVAQVAHELGIGLVDYSMTHHTRQSAIGLPIIEKREFGGKECSISEYTMSEIIASVYENIETNKNTEGILFLDEINCVSETLAPAMLRFLQSKIFGGHKIPDGWVVVCAGNPPEYNKSACTFDIATLDRLKRVEVEPDYQAWRAWAATQGTHPTVISFLNLRPDCFYQVNTKGKTQHFVTARAWSDLSTMMRLYDHHNLSIDENLVSHYIQLPSVAKEFSAYYALFANYEEKFRIKDILLGNVDEELTNVAKEANFDERASLVSLLVDSMTANAESAVLEHRALRLVRPILENVLKQGTGAQSKSDMLVLECENIEEDLRKNALYYRSDHHARFVRNRAVAILEDIAAKVNLTEKFAGEGSSSAPKERREDGNDSPNATNENKAKTPKTSEECIISEFDSLLSCQDTSLSQASQAMNFGITFIEKSYGKENELVLCLSAITANPILSDVIAEYGCDAYFANHDLIMIDARRAKLKKRLDELT